MGGRESWFANLFFLTLGMVLYQMTRRFFIFSLGSFQEPILF
jgi:hypothetical protein